MEKKKSNNQNISNQNTINNFQKEEDDSIMTLFWEGLVNIFKPEENKGQKQIQKNNKNK